MLIDEGVAEQPPPLHIRNALQRHLLAGITNSSQAPASRDRSVSTETHLPLRYSSGVAVAQLGLGNQLQEVG